MYSCAMDMRFPSPSPRDAEAALMMGALGGLPRLSVYLVLIRSGEKEITVPDLEARTEMPASTLKHHLSALVAARLYCTACYGEIRRLSSFLLRERCAQSGELMSVQGCQPH
jgi:ArsR family transcriptional regulator, arsenate/arsenite/antimonite-responsive transcriptional repressor